jgi:hypothetical protein
MTNGMTALPTLNMLPPPPPQKEDEKETERIEREKAESNQKRLPNTDVPSTLPEFPGQP